MEESASDRPRGREDAFTSRDELDGSADAAAPARWEESIEAGSLSRTVAILALLGDGVRGGCGCLCGESDDWKGPGRRIGCEAADDAGAGACGGVVSRSADLRGRAVDVDREDAVR